jgi:hypothetical protein
MTDIVLNALNLPSMTQNVSNLDSECSVQEISMSTTFYPREDNPSDLAISTIDGVIFSVHKSVLLQKSTNSFAGLVSYQPDCLFTSGAYLHPIASSNSIDHRHLVMEDSSVFNLVRSDSPQVFLWSTHSG